jgi:hypothetical protein
MAPTLRLDAAGGRTRRLGSPGSRSNCACAMSLPPSDRLDIVRGVAAGFGIRIEAFVGIVLLIVRPSFLSYTRREGNH